MPIILEVVHVWFTDSKSIISIIRECPEAVEDKHDIVITASRCLDNVLHSFVVRPGASVEMKELTDGPTEHLDAHQCHCCAYCQGSQ